MKKKEFMREWKRIREAALHKMYHGAPHGLSCLAMSLTEVEQEGERLWRKYRPSLKTMSVAEFNQNYDKPDEITQLWKGKKTCV